MNELTPYESAIILRAGYRGSQSAWRPATYTCGTIILPGDSPETSTGELRLIATDGNLGAFIATGNDNCYYLGHIQYFTGKPRTVSASKPTPSKETAPKRAKSKRQFI